MGSIFTRNLLLFALAWSPALLAGNASPDPVQAVSIDTSMTLSEVQLSSLETAALNGDPEAAFRVFEQKRALFWLKRSADAGYAPAVEKLRSLKALPAKL